MSDHFNSFWMNEVLLKLEQQSFFARIGEERTLRFIQDSLALSRYHDGNPGEALDRVGQRLGICYYCWDRGDDLRQGICRDCRAADSIVVEPEDADTWPDRKAAVGYAFIREQTVREVVQFLPKERTTDLDLETLRKVPGTCMGMGPHVREISIDSPWSIDYLPGRRRGWGTPVLMIEMLAQPYPKVVQRLRRYVSMLTESLRGSRSVAESPPVIIPVLLYNGLPSWTPRSIDEGWDRFPFTFIDVGRLRPEQANAHGWLAALSNVETARRAAARPAWYFVGGDQPSRRRRNGG